MVLHALFHFTSNICKKINVIYHSTLRFDFNISSHMIGLVGGTMSVLYDKFFKSQYKSEALNNGKVISKKSQRYVDFKNLLVTVRRPWIHCIMLRNY